MINLLKSLKKDKQLTTIAFYNVENLFDTIDNPHTLDDDFTLKGKKRWSLKRYRNKIKKLGRVMVQLGTNKSKYPPAIIGLAEVENKKTLEDLISYSELKHHHYGYCHFDSPDQRGIDVALLYNKLSFELLHTEQFPIIRVNNDGEREYTRDILKVTGNLHGEMVHVLVNHWPSRREGQEETEPKRINAAETVIEIIAKIRDSHFNAKIIVMGDFNDDPTSKSVKRIENSSFINPMTNLWDTASSGTLTYKGKWNLFDQILLSDNFLNPKDNAHYFKHAEVFNKKWLKIYKGKLKGSPFRTYIGKWYQGGFSDHFPVYVFLKKSN